MVIKINEKKKKTVLFFADVMDQKQFGLKHYNTHYNTLYYNNDDPFRFGMYNIKAPCNISFSNLTRNPAASKEHEQYAVWPDRTEQYNHAAIPGLIHL